jgi:hypothetical protein
MQPLALIVARALRVSNLYQTLVTAFELHGAHIAIFVTLQNGVTERVKHERHSDKRTYNDRHDDRCCLPCLIRMDAWRASQLSLIAGLCAISTVSLFAAGVSCVTVSR